MPVPEEDRLTVTGKPETEDNVALIVVEPPFSAIVLLPIIERETIGLGSSSVI